MDKKICEIMMSENDRVWIGKYRSNSADRGEGTERERMALGGVVDKETQASSERFPSC